MTFHRNVQLVKANSRLAGYATEEGIFSGNPNGVPRYVVHRSGYKTLQGSETGSSAFQEMPRLALRTFSILRMKSKVFII